MAATSVVAPPTPVVVGSLSSTNHEVEGVRAVAALAVVVTHVSLNAMGNRGPFGGLMARLDVGVAVFFVLSGYLLYRPFAAALLQGRPLPSARRYLRHRLIRIVPAYLVVVVASFLFAASAGLVLPSTAFSPVASGVTSVPFSQMVRFATFTQVYWKDSVAGPFPQAWTLCVEMAFYLLLPVVAWALARNAPATRAARLRRQWIVLGAFVVVAQLFRLWIVLHDPAYVGVIGADYTKYKAWLPNHLDIFALGMGMAVLTVEREDGGPGAGLGERLERLLARPGAAAVSWLLALGALVVAGYGLGLSRTNLSYDRIGEFTRQASYAAVAVCVVLPAVFGRSAGGAIRSFLASRPMQFLGRISYGIYLWQIIVIGRWVSAPSYTGGVPDAARHPGQQFNVAFWPTLLWTLAVTIILATITWYAVERPWLRFRNRPLGTFTGGLWVIGILSFAGRLWAIGTANARNPGNGDPWFYHAQANMLADGVGFGEPIQWVTQGRFVASAIHPPLFTLWLTPASMLGARSFLSHKTMAAFAGVALVVVAGLLARRLAGDRAGLIAAALVALYPDLWIIDGTLWPEGLYTVAVGLTLLAAYRWKDEPTLPRAALVGAGVGAAVLTRGEALLLLPLLCLPLAWSGRREVGRWFLHAAVMAVVALGLLAPWTVRNLIRFDHPVPVSTNSEEVLYYANCPDTYEGPFIGSWSFNCQERARQERVAAGLPADPPGDESERAAAWGALGREYAREHTGRLPFVAAARVSRVWDLRYAENSARAIALEGRPLEWSKRGLWIYRLVLVPGLVGLWLARRRGRTVWPLVSMLVMITLTAVYAYGHVRFRTVGDLVLIVGAAVTLDAVLRAILPSSLVVETASDGTSRAHTDTLDVLPEPGAR